jgi:translation initiation factor 1A
MEAKCFDNVTRLCMIRGKMNKRQWIAVGDIILVSLREYQDGRGDIIGKYTVSEARSLKQAGEIPDTIVTNKDDNPDNKEEDDVPFAFEDI